MLLVAMLTEPLRRSGALPYGSVQHYHRDPPCSVASIGKLGSLMYLLPSRSLPGLIDWLVLGTIVALGVATTWAVAWLLDYYSSQPELWGHKGTPFMEMIDLFNANLLADRIEAALRRNEKFPPLGTFRTGKTFVCDLVTDRLLEKDRIWKMKVHGRGVQSADIVDVMLMRVIITCRESATLTCGFSGIPAERVISAFSGDISRASCPS